MHDLRAVRGSTYDWLEIDYTHRLLVYTHKMVSYFMFLKGFDRLVFVRIGIIDYEEDCLSLLWSWSGVSWIRVLIISQRLDESSKLVYYLQTEGA